MKTQWSGLARFVFVLFMVVCTVAPRSTAQPQPTLGLRVFVGQPTLSLTGVVGTAYAIQYATGLSSSNVWADRTLLQVRGASTVWTDPLSSTSGQRFYRAVSVPAPADTNLVFIQPGTFTMGSPTNEVGRYANEGPQTVVTLSRGFWMSKYLVTQGDYLAIMGINPSFYTPANGYLLDLTRPVEQVSWFAARNYCAFLTVQELGAGRIPTNCVYRLPTEAEWEYSCRAGTTTRFHYGDDIGYASLGNYAWFLDNGGVLTQPVGQKLPNGWGLYDMAGNVWEWCQDGFNYNYSGGSVTDPASSSGAGKVCRGGGFGDPGSNCRSAFRTSYGPSNGAFVIGFRVVLAAGQP